MYTITIGEKSFDISVKGKTVEVDGHALDFDIVHELLINLLRLFYLSVKE